jgi:hypothetical protein
MHLLLRFLRHVSRWGHSFSRCVGIVRTALWVKTDLGELQHTLIANDSTVTQNPLQLQAEVVVLCCPCPAYGMPVKKIHSSERKT